MSQSTDPAGVDLPIAPESPQARVTTRLVFATIFVDLIGFAIVLPLLPSYAARYSSSDAAIGALVASYSLCQFLLAPVWGRLSDRIGRRPVLLIGLVGSVGSYLLFGLAASFAALLLSRLLAGGVGATVNVAQATLADLSPPEKRARMMGLIGAAFGLAFIVGPALAGLTSRLGDAAPGLLAAGLSAVNLVVAWFVLPETKTLAAPRRQPAVPVAWDRLAAPLAVMFFETLAFTAIYVVFPLYCERVLGYSRGQISALYVLMGVVTTVVQGWLVGRLAPRVGEARLMVVGCGLLALGLAGVPTAPDAGLGGAVDLALFLAAVTAVAAGTGLVGPAVAAYVSRISDDDEQGRALGVVQSVGSMARIAGPPLSGAISQVGPGWSPFLAAAGSSALAMLLALGGLAAGTRRGRQPVDDPLSAARTKAGPSERR